MPMDETMEILCIPGKGRIMKNPATEIPTEVREAYANTRKEINRIHDVTLKEWAKENIDELKNADVEVEVLDFSTPGKDPLLPRADRDSRPVISSRLVLNRTVGQIGVITEKFDGPGSIIMTTIPKEIMKEVVNEAFVVPSLTHHPSSDLSQNHADATLMNCSHCNAPLPSSAQFCRKCGNRVNQEAT
ncbi:MAG: zinc ribbon domain-containing protein [Methanomicrobiales archaeon]